MNKKVLIALFVLLSLAAAAVAWAVFKRPPAEVPVDNRVATGQDPRIPSLGGRSLPMPQNEPKVDEPDSGTPENQPDVKPADPPPEAENSEREIDIWLNNLAIATRARNRRGVALNHEMLAKARPSELVNQRVQVVIESETNAWVRIQYFLVFHGHEAADAWAWSVHDARLSKFMGGDTLYTSGEVEELSLIARQLFSLLAAQWDNEDTPDERAMALLRNLLNTEQPGWLLVPARDVAFRAALEHELTAFALALQLELKDALLRRTLEPGLRDDLFMVFALCFDPLAGILTELERAEWRDYAAALPRVYGPRGPRDDKPATAGFEARLAELAELPGLFERLLQGDMPAEHKRLLIQRIAEFEVPDGRAMIEAGLTRKDANLPDYLIAFGTFAESEADLQRLTAAAGGSDAAAAQAAIEGLRRSSMPAADVELRRILEHGDNPGVKSQALGALLGRAAKGDELLEEYLAPAKDASLRAVAVAHVPITNPDRLRRVIDEDASPRVRQAALTRLAETKPTDSVARKDLQFYFKRVADRDSSPVIRAAARKYAEDLNE